MRRVFVFDLIAVILLMFAVAEAGAAERQWRVLSGDGHDRTSDCIGSNKSPLCLAETVLACAAWSEYYKFTEDGVTKRHAICDRFYASDYGGARLRKLGPRPAMRYIYRWDVWTVSADDIPAWIKERYLASHYGLRPGWTVVDLYVHSCLWERCPSGAPEDEPPVDYKGVLYRIPSTSVIMKPAEKGGWDWKQIYVPSLEGRDIYRHWLPKRWRVK